MKCPRCGVEIAEDKLAMPNRCPDWRCPTMPDEIRWRMRGQDAVKSDAHPGVTGGRATQLSDEVRRKEPEKDNAEIDPLHLWPMPHLQARLAPAFIERTEEGAG